MYQTAEIKLFTVQLDEPEFALDPAFVAGYAERVPPWGPVGYIVFKRTYSRVRSDGTSEEWHETCERVVNGVYGIQQRHCQMNNVHWDADKARRSAEEMYDRMWNMKWLPPGRGLWMMGTDFVKRVGSAALLNCAFCSTEHLAKDFSEPFCWLMDMSMLGVGVGGDVRGAGSVIIRKPLVSSRPHVIEDSREGWIKALEILLDAYVGKGKLPSAWVYDLIRPYGAPIRGFGGVSSGDAPLRQLLEKDLPSVLDQLVDLPITVSAIVDMFNFIGKCVVSGNVRRSAEIMFGEPEDQEFRELKDPELHGAELNDRRWASNNSLFARRGMDYTVAAAQVVKNGEPGFIWLDTMREYGRMSEPKNGKDRRVVGSNPCVEISLEDRELCCLAETFPANCDSYEDYERTLKFAYLYAKTVVILPTHSKKANAVMRRNARIGISQSGIVNNFAKVGRREHFRWSDEGYRFIQHLDEIYSEWLAVRKSIKLTSVKPSGSVSKLNGSTSGIHYPIAEFYVQRIRFANGSELLEQLIRGGYPHEPCVYAPNTTVVSFPCRELHFSKAETDASMWEQVANAAGMQRWWADNQVSATITFDNADKVAATRELVSVLESFEDQLKGISFLPRAHGYQQAPWEPIDEQRYIELASAIHTPVTSARSAQHEVTERFCDGASCEVLPAAW